MLANRRDFLGSAMAGFATTAVGSSSGRDARSNRFFDVTQFGASDSADDDSTDAITAAVAALERASGGTLYFPAGTYKIHREIRLPDAPVRILGDGPELSRVVQTSANAHGFVFDAAVNNPSLRYGSHSRLEIAHIGLLNTTRSSGAAVFASWASMTAGPPVFVASDLSVAGAESVASTWAHGILLENCGASRINAYTFQGDRDRAHEESPFPFAANAAIRMFGTDAPSVGGVRSHVISTFACSYANRALDLEGDQEGITLRDFRVQGVGTGVSFEGRGSAGNISLEGGRLIVRVSAIDFRNVVSVTLRDVESRKGDQLGKSGFEGSLVALTTCRRIRVVGCDFVAPKNALLMSDCRSGDVTSCLFESSETGTGAQVRLEGGTNQVILSMNNFTGSTVPPIFIGAGTRHNNLFGNTVSGRSTLISPDSSMAFNASASNTQFAT